MKIEQMETRYTAEFKRNLRLPNRDINPQQIKKIIETFDVSS